jgi:IS30 family transposase
MRALEKRKSRGRKDRLKSKKIREYVTSHLKEGWSPEQIAGRMKIEKIGSISHEAIYQYVYAQVHRGGYGYLRPGCEDLRMFLRRKQKRRRRKGARRCQRILVPKGISIELRPKVVDQRKRIGDFEGDTVESVNHRPGVNTLLERKTGMFFVTKVENKTSKATAEAVAKRMKDVPSRLKHTLTNDNGFENSAWKMVEEQTGLKVFFAHPYSSHERGANENANGLLREYFPKKTDFSMIPDETIQAVELRLNTRPRKRLGWRTPLEVWSVALRG